MESFDALDYNQPTGSELARRTTLARRRLARIRQLRGLAPETMRLLDVGCSRGQYVAAAEQFGFRAEGIEPAPRIAAAARAQGLNVHTGLLDEQCFPAASFDVITLFEVIEHLKEPLSLMRECHRILKPGGIVCLSTGNTRSWTVAAMRGRWDYFDLEQDGGHVSFYNPRSLALLAERTGYTVADIETSRVRFTERSQVPLIVHTLAKAAAELLSLPAKLMRRGHQMLAYLRRT
jgi:2-polyprenyl-3-methyl-5-hydroxy-6-metoxy-1,4-benzoquinol methylase